MDCSIEIIPRILSFKRPAGTSRGVYHDRKIYYLRLTSPEKPGIAGIGECAPLPQLSCDDIPDYEQVLSDICCKIEESGGEFDSEEWYKYPSIAFGVETAFLHYGAESPAFKHTPFSQGETGIPINGLVWMGEYSYMYHQMKEKMEKGYRCIKLKIGAINFEEELDLIKYVRQQFSARDVELRVDANGAFSPGEALRKLNRLSKYDLHSIEQPIAAGNWEAMARLIKESPIPVALDEELIGHNTREQRVQLLETLRPHYIVIKPSLHANREGWVLEATTRGIGWWATSALESNIGLNAIAQWVSGYKIVLPQGLGTGMLFTENVDSPLSIVKDELWYNPLCNCLNINV